MNTLTINQETIQWSNSLTGVIIEDCTKTELFGFVRYGNPIISEELIAEALLTQNTDLLADWANTLSQHLLSTSFTEKFSFVSDMEEGLVRRLSLSPLIDDYALNTTLINFPAVVEQFLLNAICHKYCFRTGSMNHKELNQLKNSLNLIRYEKIIEIMTTLKEKGSAELLSV